MNRLDLPTNSYDIIVVKGVLHHLTNLEHIVTEIHKALKPGGLLWVDDTNGEEQGLAVLLAGGFSFILPTETSYADKFRALFKFGFRTTDHVKASIEAHGLSPFEGAGREQDWYKLISQQFTVERRINLPAFTGYVSAQWRARDAIAIPVLKVMRAVDRFLIRVGLLRNTTLVLFARK